MKTTDFSEIGKNIKFSINAIPFGDIYWKITDFHKNHETNENTENIKFSSRMHPRLSVFN